MSQAPDIYPENVEAKYNRHKDFGVNALQEYETLYKNMCSKLNADHLEPFAKILMERENIALKGQNEIINTIRHNIQQQMLKALQSFWNSYNVSEALILLEMYKDKFKSYEGHKWNMNAKTPWERTRPIRMRYNENRLRYLQAQINFQNEQLEKVLQENMALRKHISDVKQQRAYLTEAIGNFRKTIQLAKPKIMEMKQQMLTENEINEPNIVAENDAK